MGFILFFVMMAGYAILMANLPPQQGGAFGDRVVSPTTLYLLIGEPAKLKFPEVAMSGSPDNFEVEARTQTGLLLTFSRNAEINPPETQIRVSKVGWIGYLIFNFEGPVIRSVILGNGRAIPPESLRGDTRALAGRLYQRLYQLGRDSNIRPPSPPPSPPPSLSG
jgi:hypothetical protein